MITINYGKEKVTFYYVPKILMKAIETMLAQIIKGGNVRITREVSECGSDY